MKKMMVLLAAAMVLQACTTDPYTGERKASKAAIGAVAGAVVGAATSSKNDRAKGAAIGAAVGGGAGYWMDVQEKKLRDQLQGTGVSVTREGDNIRLNMPGDLTFATDSAEIQSQFYSVLNSVALVLKEYKKTRIKVSGHTDSRGADAYNQGLSERRANSVVSYFVSQGVALDRLYAVGYGEKYPIASNDSSAGREQNRRVELEIVPLEG